MYRLDQYQPSGKVYSHQNFLSSPYFPLGIGKGKMKEVVWLLLFSKVNFEGGGKLGTGSSVRELEACHNSA